MSKRSISVFLALLALANSALASPSPESAEGALVDDGELVIKGVGFGVKEQPAPIIFDTQDKVWINGTVGTPYSSLANGADIPFGPPPLPWSMRTAGSPLKVIKGDYPHYAATIDGQDAWMEYPNGFPDPSTREVERIYIRWWFKLSAEAFTPGATESNKFIRVWDSLGSNAVVRASWTQMHVTVSGTEGDLGLPTFWGDAHPTPNVWNLMEFYLQVRPTFALKAWVNGTLIHDRASAGALPSTTYGLHPRLWGLDGSMEANWAGETLQLSDYYADKTLARVEVGDSPSWSNVRIREPQVPIEWSAERIKVRLHQGLLGSLDGKFLYVIDADGRVNESGLPLGSAVPKPPSPVSVE